MEDDFDPALSIGLVVIGLVVIGLVGCLVVVRLGRDGLGGRDGINNRN
jgi:hypothetical protein